MVSNEPSQSAPRVPPPFDLREALGTCLPDVDVDVAVLHLSLLHLGRIVESTIQATLIPDGLEISEHSVLSSLWFAGPPHTMSPTQLSQVILQTTSGMSKTLRRIQRLGLIERVADPSDGRARLVVLTDRGRDVADRHLHQLVDQWEAGLQGAGADEIRTMARTIWSLVGYMDRRFEISEAESSASASSS